MMCFENLCSTAVLLFRLILVLVPNTVLEEGGWHRVPHTHNRYKSPGSLSLPPGWYDPPMAQLGSYSILYQWPN